MRPTGRVALALVGAVVVGGLLASAYGPALTTLKIQRGQCLNDPGGQTSSTWCNVLVSYPNRTVLVAAALVAVVVVILGLLVARWCLRPFAELIGVVDRMGPANLGYRLRLGRRGDVMGRLAHSLDAMMDRIATGYEGQRRFAANASHELRTPLAVQRTLIEVGMAERPTPEQLELLTRQLLATNERNERLIEGLLVLAEAEQCPVGHTPQRLDRLAADVVRQHQETAVAAGVTLDLHHEPTTVAGERVLLERLLTNLVGNAIAYNRPQDGRVDVVVGDRTLTVTNTGPAVAAAEVDALFEAFRRGRGERLTHGGGAGLGLTICRALATVHGASITAAPGPDGGLAVTVQFPPAP